MILFLVLATTILLMPVVSIKAPQNKISCSIRATYDDVAKEWQGYIVFPGEITYDITWFADPDPRFVGHTGTFFPKHLEKFVETWEISDGSVLASGYDKGTFSEDSWKFWMNGKVETATADLAYLAGAQVHIRGIAWIESGAFQLIGEMFFTGYGK